MAFKMYKPSRLRGISKLNAPYVSVNKAGNRMTFNKPALQSLGLDPEDATVVLGFNDQTGQVLVRAWREGADHPSHKMTVLQSENTGWVIVHGFGKAFGIDFKRVVGTHKLHVVHGGELLLRLPEGSWKKPPVEREPVETPVAVKERLAAARNRSKARGSTPAETVRNRLSGTVR